MSDLTIKVQNSSPFTTQRDNLPDFNKSNISQNKSSPNKSHDMSYKSDRFNQQAKSDNLGQSKTEVKQRLDDAVQD